jgi:phage baseplate assembly protein W
MIKRSDNKFYGYNPPFIGGLQNVMSRQEGDQIIKNDILQLLLTIPGERVMRPTFGVNLRNAVFENMTSSMISGLQSEIIEKISRFEPRVDVSAVTIVPNDITNLLTIKIQVALKKDPSISFVLETNLTTLGAGNV